MAPLYDKKLSEEWIYYVEQHNPHSTRESEMFPYIQKWIAKYKPKTLADIGCGQGMCSQFITDDIHYTGIDISETLLEKARELYPEKHKLFLQGDVYDLPLKDNSIEALLSIWVWSHLENLLKAAKEMYRILEPGGKALIITANPETYEERKTFYSEYSVEGNLLTGTFDLGNGSYLSDTTLYLHEMKDIEDAITKAGFSIIDTLRMGKSEMSGGGLYVVIEIKKIINRM